MAKKSLAVIHRNCRLSPVTL